MTVREVMADVKVRLRPEDTLRSAAAALRDARTGLAIVERGAHRWGPHRA